MFNGTATQVAFAGQLTSNLPSEAGTIFYKNTIVTDAFNLSFEIQLGDGDGGAFVLQTDGPNAVGMAGGGLATAGLHGYALELDTYKNMACGDVDDNHASVDVLGSTCGEVQVSAWTKSLTPFGINLHDGQWHHATVDFDNGHVKLRLDNKDVIPDVSLPNWKPGNYFYGFSGSTGDATAVQLIRNVQVTFPYQRCL